MPWIPLAIGAIEGGVAIAQLIAANKAKKRAVLPSSEDSRSNAYTSQLNQNRANLSTGAAYRSFIDSLDKERANLTSDITKRTGGYYGSAITGAERVMGKYGESLSRFGAEALNSQLGYDQLIGGQVNRGEARRFNLQEQQYLQNMADYKENKQAGMANLFGAIEEVAGTDFSGNKKIDPTTASNLLSTTAYDDIPEFNTGSNATPDIPESPESTLDAFGQNALYPKSFGDSFMKKKRYTLSY